MICDRHICSGAYANNMKCFKPLTVVILFIAVSSYGIYIDICMPYINHILAYVAYIWYFSGTLVFGTHMAITCLLSHDADDAMNDTIALVILKYLFRGVI